MSQVGEAIQTFEDVTPRFVADLHSVSYDVQFVREDIEGEYTADDLDEAYRLIMARTVTGDDFKTLIGEGRFHAETLIFEDIIVFFFPSERYEGVFASFDYDGGFPIDTLVQHVSDDLNEGQ